jgi:hypothetical protein
VANVSLEATGKSVVSSFREEGPDAGRFQAQNRVRQNTDFMSRFNLLGRFSPVVEKINFRFSEICVYLRASRALQEGRTRRHERWRGMRWTPHSITRRAMPRADGEGVWS